MKKKRVLLISGTLAAVVVTLGLLALLPARPRLTEEQFDLIQVGMTRSDVAKVLGCKPGDYSLDGGLIPIDMRHYAKEQQERGGWYEEWAADNPTPPRENANGPIRQDALAIRVWFDEDGKVIDKCRMGYTYTIPSMPSRLKIWFRRLITPGKS